MTKKRARKKESDSGGGLMTGMRLKMKKVAGTGPSSPESRKRRSRLIDYILWAAVIAALIFFFVQRCA